MSDPFLGEIRMVGFNFAPYGWALCQGQLLSVNQNQALFALLGTNYGGNGQSTFGLPDMQGRSPVGVGTGLGLAPIVIGEKGGEEDIQLTNIQLPSHTHTAQAAAGGIASTGTVSIPATTATTGGSATPSATSILGSVESGGRGVNAYYTSAATTTLAPANVTVHGDSPAIQVGATGLGQPFSLRNPFIGLTCVIALQGIYPTRP